MAVRELVKLSWPDSGQGVARTQAWQERLRVLAVHKPPATPGKPGDLQGARAHLGHDHVAPRGARGHHWAGWSPLHGLCQGVGRSEGDIGGFFRVKKNYILQVRKLHQEVKKKGWDVNLVDSSQGSDTEERDFGKLQSLHWLIHEFFTFKYWHHTPRNSFVVFQVLSHSKWRIQTGLHLRAS